MQLPLHVVLRLAIAGGSMYAIGRWLVSPADIIAAWATMSTVWVLPAALLMPAGLALQWWKWRLLVQATLPAITEAQIGRSMLTGFGLGLLTPGRLGELGRGAAWPGVRGQAAALAGADRLVSGLVTVAIGGACALAAVWIVHGALIALALLASVVTAGLALRCLGARISPAKWMGRLLGQLTGLAAKIPLRAGARAWRHNMMAAGAFNVLFFLQMFCLLRACGPLSGSGIMYGEALVLLAIPAMFALKTLLPISFLDFGIREGAAIFVLGAAGVAPAIAVQAALMLFAMNVLLPGIVGLLTMCLDTRSASHSPQRTDLAHVR